MSYIDIDATKIVKACSTYLNNRYKRIQAEREVLIQDRMKGLFFKRTREQAIESLESERKTFSKWYQASMMGFIPAETVKELKNLAIIAERNNTPVRLDSEAAYILRDYL